MNDLFFITIKLQNGRLAKKSLNRNHSSEKKIILKLLYIDDIFIA